MRATPRSSPGSGPRRARTPDYGLEPERDPCHPPPRLDDTPAPQRSWEPRNRLEVAAEELGLAQHGVPEREHLVQQQRSRVTDQIQERVVLGDHQIPVAELRATIDRARASPRRGAVGPDVVNDGVRCIPGAPPEQPCSPREVGIAAPTGHVFVEELIEHRQVLERRAPVDGRCPVGPERLARQ
jgi:hypothetical protein